MSKDQFDAILSKIHHRIRPIPNNFRKDTISPKEKLVLTLRFLATGASFQDLGLRFVMGSTTVRRCILQTITAINSEFQSRVLPKQNTSSWKNIAKDFLIRWNFPNCLGAVDGKHAQMFCPRKSGSLFFNYKKTFSINLMAVVDARYRFIMVDIGSYGSNADSAIFSNCFFGNNWISTSDVLKVPKDSNLPGTQTCVPHVLVGDEAFGLKTNLLTPYGGQNLTYRQRIFNYRFSRARRIVENAFGILAHTWRILLKSIEVQVAFAKQILLCCCILHNFLKMDLDEIVQGFENSNVDEDIQEEAYDEPPEDHPASEAFNVREHFADWCLNEGDVPFQHSMI